MSEDTAVVASEASYLGSVLGDRFRIAERIGTGGMGSVWRAEQLGLGRDVAVKILKHELVKDAETVERFKREARATSRLVHPNTVRVFDFGETPDGSLFLAMELLEGELLTSRLRQEGGVGAEEALLIVCQLLRSLSEAHSHGIIHRDLKPDNVFLARVPGHDAPVVKVLDFGIAKILDGDRLLDPLETQAGTVFGTPRYMSPEQARGKPLDPRSDLYSVGVVLYQLLTGRAPFDDDDAVVVMARHIRERPASLRDAAPEGRMFPAVLDTVVARALEKDPRRRLPTADAFERALLACLPEVRAAAAQAEGDGGTVAVPARFRRRRVAAIALGAALTGGLTALVASQVLGLRGSGDRGVVPWLGATGSPPRSAPAPVDVVETTVDSKPSGARVLDRAGKLLGATPLVLERVRGAEVELTLRLPGHGPATAFLTMDGARKLISLAPIRRRGGDAEDAPPDEVSADDETAEEGSGNLRRRRRVRPAEPYEPFD